MNTIMKNGYFGIGAYQMKNYHNLGTLWRSAINLNADFIFIIGKRFKRQRSDTVKGFKKIPLYEYNTYEEFYNNIPYSCRVVCVEQSEKSKPLSTFKHPESCIYLLGAEDTGLPERVMKDKQVVHIDSKSCLNVAVAGSIIMYDRQLKGI